MQIISETIEFKITEPTAVVLGKFDGVHIGHQLLITKLLEQKKKGLKTVVFTFDKSPASLFIQDGDTYRELCTLQEKRDIFEQYGVDVLIEFPMNIETAAIPAEEFITEILQKRLNCKSLIAGEDISFGYKGIGDCNMLLDYSRSGGFCAEILEKLMIKDVLPEEDSVGEVSSTYIRKEICAGNVAKANALLGREFSVTGQVIHGNHLGSTVLDMPTANIKWPENKVFPAFGVYFTRILADNTWYNGITNVGIKPTIEQGGQKEVLAESYLYDFDADLYGKTVTVAFYAYHRPEQKFENLESLKVQLQKDMRAGREFGECDNL